MSSQTHSLPRPLALLSLSCQCSLGPLTRFKFTMLIYVLIAVCAILLFFKLRPSDYWTKKGVIQVGAWEGPQLKFFIGNRSLPEYFKEVYDAYSTRVGIYLGSRPALVLKDLEDVQAVMASDFQSFYKRGISTNPNDLLADNVLFIDDFKRWKILRQKLTPVFTSSKLKNMFYIIDQCARDFVEFVQNSGEMRAKPFNCLYTYTTASIGASVFGIDTRTKNTMESPFLDMSWKALEPTLKTNFKFFISGTFPKLFKLLKLRIFGEFEDFFIGSVRNVLESRRHDKVKRHDFIDMCLELQKNGLMKDPNTGYELEPSIEILAAQAFFFFIAGADTTANTMHFTLLSLAGHQDVLTRLHEEIDAVFAGKEQLTYSDIEQLQYLDMVVSESMRMYPTIGSIQRLCTKDTWLPGAKVKIDKDTVIIIPVYGIHRDARFFLNPDSFDPERFSPNNLTNLKKFSYLPFGEGNRICIGK